jgi:3-oxoacyl-[acyl-carrier protein] reductase
MDLGLHGRIALVTGASQGIGAAIAARLAQEGCRLVLVARREAQLRAVAAGLDGPFAAYALPLVCDVTVAADVAAAVAAATAHFGGIDILVNNAGGLTTGGLNPFDQLSDEDFIATYMLNVISAVRFSRAVLPGMAAKGWGRIISISSESGVQPDPIGADYNAAKAALNAFSKTLSKSVAASGVRVNVVSPAFTLSPGVLGMIEQHAATTGQDRAAAEASLLGGFRPNIAVGRGGQPEEIAAAVAFLASEQADFVNGLVMRVDGGSVASVGG